MAFVSASQFGVVGHDGVPLLELLRCHGGHLLGLRRESEKTTMPGRSASNQPALRHQQRHFTASTSPLNKAAKLASHQASSSGAELQ